MIGVDEKLGLRGRVALSIFEDGELVHRGERDNLICNAGLNQLSAALLWSFAQDQSGAMGGSLTPAMLWPIYGALGSSATAPATTDLQLGAELGREVVSDGGFSGGQVLLTFFFPTTAIDWTINEVGVFVSGSSTATSAANTGLLLNHALYGPVTKTAAQTSTLQVTFTF